MTEAKLAFRNLKRDFNIYILLIISSIVFLALIIGFQSTITSGDLGAMLSQEKLSNKKIFFKIILWGIACVQYLLMLFFFNSYYRFINKIRVRELALYKVIGYTRFNVFKIIFMEGMYIYFIVAIFSIIIAFFTNLLIIKFINYYLAITIKLNASLNINTIIVTLILFLILVLVNIFRTYYKAVKVDVDVALNEEAVQKKTSITPKYYIICIFVLGIILLINMTFLTTKVTFSILGGIIIMALFYAFGLFLIINAIAKGYKYLVSKRYLKKHFNLLLISEVNFHLNKSKLVILSSIIFMMLSIGALVLSQVIVAAVDKSFVDADYIIYPTYAKRELDEGNWEISNQDAMYYSTRISIMEDNEEVLDKYGIDTSNNAILISEEALKEAGANQEETLNYSIGENKINFKIYIEPKESLINDFDDEVEAFMPINNILKVDSFSNFNTDYNTYEYLEEKVVKGDLKKVKLNEVWYVYDEKVDEKGNPTSEESVNVVKLSEYNKYLDMIGEKQINLAKNEVWADNIDDSDLSKYNVKGRSYNNLYVAVVNDETFNSLEEDKISYTEEVVYYEAVNNSIKMKIDEELKDVNSHSTTVTGVNEQKAMGDKVFILLTAFYIAIIFIFSNAILIAINLLSHAIENKKVYTKLEEMGMSRKERRKYVSSFIRRFYLIPFVIGTISGVIVTNFAIKLLFNYEFDNMSIVNYKLVIYIMVLYSIIYILFISITKYIYNKIINE